MSESGFWDDQDKAAKVSAEFKNHDRALAFCRDVLGFAVETDVPDEDDWGRVVLTIPGSDSRIHLARRYRRALRGRRPLAAVEDSEGNPVFIESWKA